MNRPPKASSFHSKLRLKVYLDTSVVSALFDDRNPERRSLTDSFFRDASTYEVFVSEVTLAEIERTPDVGLRKKMRAVISGFSVLSGTPDVERLAREYVRHGAVPEAFAEDAYHIALAAANGMDFLLSWNFRHLVRRRTRDVVKMVNTLQGLGLTEIITPAELL